MPTDFGKIVPRLGRYPRCAKRGKKPAVMEKGHYVDYPLTAQSGAD
jgi:hypothetical protein